MKIQLHTLRKLLNRCSTLAEVEVEAEVEEDKEVVEAKIPTKVNNRINCLMTHNRAHVEEETLEVGGAREDAKIIKRNNVDANNSGC